MKGSEAQLKQTLISIMVTWKLDFLLVILH